MGDYAINFGHENLARLLKDAGAYGVFEEDQDPLYSPDSVGSATSTSRFTLPASPEPGSSPQDDAQFAPNEAPAEEEKEKEKKKKKKKRASVIANEEAAQMLMDTSEVVEESRPAEEKEAEE